MDHSSSFCCVCELCIQRFFSYVFGSLGLFSYAHSTGWSFFQRHVRPARLVLWQWINLFSDFHIWHCLYLFLINDANPKLQVIDFLFVLCSLAFPPSATRIPAHHPFQTHGNLWFVCYLLHGRNTFRVLGAGTFHVFTVASFLEPNTTPGPSLCKNFVERLWERPTSPGCLPYQVLTPFTGCKYYSWAFANSSTARCLLGR